MQRRRLLAAGALAAALLPRPGLAQAFPSRPLRMVVPYGAGGSTDVLARLYAQRMGELLGQPVVVENRGGGGTLVGIRAVAGAAADGYTLLFTTSAVAMNVLTDADAGYRYEDFAPVGPTGQFPYVLLVTSSLPVRSLAELVAYGRANPGKLNYSSLGRSTPTALLATRFLAAAGIEAVEVTYSGSAAAMNDVLASVVHLIFIGATAGNMAPDRTRPLAVTAEQRLEVAPEVPTFAENGFPTLLGGTWFGLFAPAATPGPVLTRLSLTTQQATDGLSARLQGMGVLPVPGGIEGFAEYIRRDQALWEADLRRAGLLTR
jgi:tripartite-type tricarboxylate transporter receptor subunit TctC